MTLKLVRKAVLGKSVTSYKFELSNATLDSISPEPDPEIVNAVRAALDDASRHARGGNLPQPSITASAKTKY